MSERLLKQKAYAFRHKEEIILESSSGGAFSALASIIIDQSGVVYGACFDDNLKVIHQRADNLKACSKFRGSKYIQSSFDKNFSYIELDLKAGRKILFTGTPCQCKTLKQYCCNHNITDENLILVDIICHGTMKPVVWEKFKDWLEEKYKSKLSAVSFRYKRARWSSYPIKLDFENGKSIVNTFVARRFNSLFFRGIALSEGCYKCPFSKLDRESDITIGDFWGIEKVIPTFPRNKGVSVIIVNTDKGKDIVEQIFQLDGVIFKACDSDDYIKYQHNLNSPTKKPEETGKFWIDFQQLPFQKVLKKYADYNLRGFFIHCIMRIMGELKITNWIKQHL